MGYEEEVQNSFKAAYGVDMKAVPDPDPRISAHHSRYILLFLRDLRRSVPGLELTARIRNMNEFGLDAAAWIREGLIDSIMEGNWYSGNAPRDVEKGVLSVTRGTGAKAYVVAESDDWLIPAETRPLFSAEQIVSYARGYRSTGIDQFGLYESTIFLWYPHVRRAIWEAGSIMAGQAP